MYIFIYIVLSTYVKFSPHQTRHYKDRQPALPADTQEMPELHLEFPEYTRDSLNTLNDNFSDDKLGHSN